ncbi:DNA-binding protein [Muribacter muris]|uniref:DNA-binding protein n=1 Tax=Muribacter muris TaxID=67855 RepID=A0A4Y9K4P9_9PAST|nr:DNA-binding protein [Muribacter muris]MBF0784331.1 DNA-binding protein [Muribacter muris]MBF0827877.1 DNA-binding protein [Muribacter muris]TFV12109.1 DNA-binding protein [Muribacter muris]
MKEWVLVKDLVGVGGLAGTPQGVAQRAKKENWQRRRVAGVKGNVFEYYVGDMPESVRQALGFTAVHFSEPPHDYVIHTRSGGELGLDIKAGKMNRQELEQALRMIEQALGLMPAQSQPQKSEIDKLNNHEKDLIRYYRKSSDDGRIAIMNLAETMAGLNREKETLEPFEAYKVA